ncbi:hypothetical protein ACF1BK_29415 [Streptomyces globisporus]|uniref:hypothetical protein n=1 Tax=Streptomyces globisporus TaxID=1908 RepID=UPI0036FBF367
MGDLPPWFHGKNRAFAGRLPPGQCPTESFPVLSAGPPPDIPTGRWSFTLTGEAGESRSWSWDEMMALPQEEPFVDIHRVTR